MEYSYNYASNPDDGADSYSALSIVGLVCAFLFSIAGLVISIIAHSEAEKLGSNKSQTMAKAGIIVSAVKFGLVAAGLAALIVLLIVSVVVGSTLQFI